MSDPCPELVTLRTVVQDAPGNVRASQRWIDADSLDAYLEWWRTEFGSGSVRGMEAHDPVAQGIAVDYLRQMIVGRL